MGAHKHTNRLINETSPYLLQHAHNPVDWHPWGEEALEIAKREDKPLLVSIGYAACHWCHVMERESFENEEIADIMNRFFVNIKVDREERPDIDHIYMDAVQAMTGSGGWPLNVFLTPDGKPFYGGTYFPPQPIYNRVSWREILEGIYEAYRNKKSEIENQANSLTEHLKNSNAFGGAAGPNSKGIFTEQSLSEIAKNILNTGDKTWGGFGRAPKFPQTFCIKFLLRHYYYTREEDALKQALLSLNKMIDGGIYDHLGGGFARYSTDEKWLAPHFEKMLYDNALLLEVLAEAFQLTGDGKYKETIDETMGFIQREMMKDNGFYSALDADSEGVEGKYYTWSKQEIDEALRTDSEIFCKYYNVTSNGNWEHTNILWVTRSLQELANEQGLELADLRERVERCKTVLMERRSLRIRPGLDDKLLLGWNALMNIACSKVYAATGNENYKQLAVRNIAFIEASFTAEAEGEMLHTFKNGKAKYQAFLDDYAFLIRAYIHLQEITANPDYLDKAKKLTETVISFFAEGNQGFFFFTSRSQKDVIVRKKEIYDGATPSGNSVMAQNLHYLGIVYNITEWLEWAGNITGRLSNAILKYPTSFANWGTVVQQLTYGVPEIAITGSNSSELLSDLLKEYIPVRVLQTANFPIDNFPLLEGKGFGNKPLIYVCKNYSCKKPIENLEDLKSVLK